MLHTVQRARHLRWRQPPDLATGGRGRSAVYYLAPDRASPSGGVRNIYRHVDELNALGIPAAVVHTRPGFRCEWFTNRTRTMAARDVRLGTRDVLVVPEIYAPGFHRLPADARKVVFNQGAYLTYDHVPFGESDAGAPYAGLPNLLALLTVSQDSEVFLRHAFPGIPVHSARPVIDADIFHPPPAPAGRRVAHIVTRRSAERWQLLHILRGRRMLADWQFVPIDGCTETETAVLMRDCGMFFSFSDREGFGLPSAEAMASGCYVVGFTGLGGREFFDPEYCTPVPENDVHGFAIAAEAVMTEFQDDPTRLMKRSRLASDRVLARYTGAGLRADLSAFYSAIFDQ